MTAATSTTATLNGVTVGNTLILLATHLNGDATGGGVNCADAQATYSPADIETTGSRYSCTALSLFGANAGTHACVVTAKFGTATNSFGQCVLTEWSGMSAFDVGSGATATSAGPLSTGASAGLGSTTDVVIALALVDSAQTGWGTPAGYTLIYQDLTAAKLATSFAYKILSANTPVTTSFGTMGASAQWVATQALYLPTAGAIGRNSAQMMQGMGS
jgi:hypothetical protein